MARVTGLDRLRARLTRLPAEARRLLVAANSKSADEMVGFAKRAAPVETGRLRESIRKTVDGDGLVSIRAGGQATMVEVRKGSGVMKDYAPWIEFGRRVGRRSKRKRGRVRAQPFFYPSYRLMKPRARRRALAALRKALQKS